MAHECFENPDVAAVMNTLFVNVKVDREERPDVDAVYMDAVQALTGRGGWPMTVFCTPGGEPFFGGTYYPRESFLRLMNAVDDAWRTKRGELGNNVEVLVELVGRTARLQPAAGFDGGEVVARALSTLTEAFDSHWGGFGDAPKFPSTFALDLVLHAHDTSGNPELRTIVTTSLDAMASGGMWDHLAGGFARYSVDRQWLVPHFEKMLYDQALLLRVYAHAAVALGEPRYEQIAREIVDYVLTTLTSPAGAFYCAEDADSPNEQGHAEEGAFYTWTPGEVGTVLGDAAARACEWWGITEGGNFEGRSIPHRLAHRGEWARPPEIEAARSALLAHRATRPRPGLDDKVLTEWNAMMLSSLCEAAALLNEPAWVEPAERAGRFLLATLRDSDGRWKRAWHVDAAPDSAPDALALDLAHVVDAMTRLYELTSDPTWLAVADSTARQLLEEHWDTDNGGLFTISSRGEQLVARQKDLMDNATPSANSIAALALMRLAALTGSSTLGQRAGDILRLLAPVTAQAPTGTCLAAMVMHVHQAGLIEVVVPGRGDEFVAVMKEAWRPHVVLARGEPLDSPLWKGRTEGRAYVCRDMVCQLPATTADELREMLTTNSCE